MVTGSFIVESDNIFPHSLSKPYLTRIGLVTTWLVACLTIACMAPLAWAGEAPQQSVDMGIINERYRELLLMDDPPGEQAVREFARTLVEDGTWPDINYHSSARSDWSPRQHLQRLRSIALATVHPDSPLKGDVAMRDAALRALDNWLEERYQSPPWWHNRIGTPLLMRDVLVLLGPTLSQRRRDSGWEVVAQYDRVEMTGANLIWFASLAIVSAAASGDADLLAQAASRAAAEIKITTDEGIQPDFSFHQHRARLQTFHYGSAYAKKMSELAWLLRDSPWAFPEDKVVILADYMIEGMDWMRRGSNTVPGTLDRAVARQGSLGNHSLARNLRLLRDIVPSRVERIDAILEREAGRGEPLIGFRHFPSSDFTVYHRKDFSFFLKTVSSRTLFTETLNRENLKGFYLNTGDGYFVRDGNEYFDLMPIWNWNLLPGLTTAMGIPDKRFRRWSSVGVQRKPFVGGVGDGLSGLTAMDYHINGAPEDKGEPKPSLTARKAWFFHNDKIISLIGDLQVRNAWNPARTALDQNRLDGPVTVGFERKRETFQRDGLHALQGVTWLHHRGVAYVPLESSHLTLTIQEESASWRMISRFAESRVPVTDRIFLPILEHGTNPEGVNTGYLIAPAVSPDDAAVLATRHGFDVLANDSDAQAIRFDDGTIMAVFYKAGVIRQNGRDLLSVDVPCVLMLRGDTIWASNPALKSTELNIETADGKRFNVDLPPDGVTAEEQSSTTIHPKITGGV